MVEAWQNGGRYMGPDRPSACHPPGWLASIEREGVARRMAHPGLPATIVPDAREIRPEDVAEWMTRADAAREVARWAQVQSANELIPISGDTLRNTGQGGSTCADPKHRSHTTADRLSGRFADRAHAGLPAAIVPDAREIRPEDVAEWMTRADAAREVARHAFVSNGAFRKGFPESGYNPKRAEEQPPHETGGRQPGLLECLPPRYATMGAAPGLPATIAPDAREITPPTLPPGCVVYMDPPYVNTTGYGNDLPRAEVVELARRWADAGAAVYISEAEPLPELDGWHTVEITSTRVGQKRTFSKQKREWLTMNRKPAWVPAVQQGLFG